MRASDLTTVADLAGYPLSAADLEQVAAILSAMQADLDLLRALDVPDDIEPILTFRVEPWA
jgi:hypothetical protein